MDYLLKRVKSFSWRLGGFVGVAVLTFLVSPEFMHRLNEAGFAVPSSVFVVGGLLVGELTKWWSTRRLQASLPV